MNLSHVTNLSFTVAAEELTSKYCEFASKYQNLLWRQNPQETSMTDDPALVRQGQMDWGEVIKG